jgi:hypothetical protein
VEDSFVAYESGERRISGDVCERRWLTVDDTVASDE